MYIANRALPEPPPNPRNAGEIHASDDCCSETFDMRDRRLTVGTCKPHRDITLRAADRAQPENILDFHTH